MSQNKKYDIVILGATGFTGNLVVEYFVTRHAETPGLRWAIAGRNSEKLKKLAQSSSLNQDIDMIPVDVADIDSLDHLMNLTSLVLTTAGPYQDLNGESVVEQCVKHGVDYIDLCGEPLWMHEMIKRYSADAEASGARLVFSCGFDSIPSDLGVLHLQTAMQKHDGTAADFIKGRVVEYQGTASGGTMATIAATAKLVQSDPELLKTFQDPYALVQEPPQCEQPSGSEIKYDEDFKAWCAPFVMATVNTRNVHRSNSLGGFRYGSDFKYEEMLLTSDGEEGKSAAKQLAMHPFGEQEALRTPGEGPDREERENGYYIMEFLAKRDQGSDIKTRVSGKGDPGYGSTSKLISEAAILLASGDIPSQGGFWTPASLMGEKLIDVLHESGHLTFELLDQ